MRMVYLIFCTIVLSFSANTQTLVASYPFTGNANDVSGSGHNGTVNGATLTTDRFGNSNSAYSFNGISNYIEALADALPTGDNSISLWFNADAGSIASRPGLLGYGGNATGSCPGNSQILIINLSGSGKYTTQANCLNNYADYTYASLPENNWYNWVVTKSGTTIKMFINGVLVSTANTATQPVIVTGKKLSIGAVVSPAGVANYTDANVGHFKGKLDDIKIYNGALTDAQVADSFSTQSLVASYPFNGNANDVSGYGNNGTVIGATLTTDRFGNANSAYLFNGTSNWIEAANSASLQLGNTFTISAWVNHNGFYNGAYQGNFYVSKGDDDNVTTGEFALASGEVDGNPNPDPSGYKRFYFNNTLAPSTYSQVFADSPAIKLSRWYNVVVTANINTLKIYVNGKLISTNSTAGVINGNNVDKLFLGRQNKVGNEYWLNGILDDVKIYNSTLSDAQIFDSYVNDLKKPGSGNAIQFTGTGSLATSPYINIGSGFDFGPQPFTYETWVKRDVISTTLNNYGKTIIVGDNNGSWGIGILNDNTLFLTKVGFNSTSSTGKIADTKWHHIAVVYSGTEVQFYIDGVAAGNPTYSVNFNNTSGNYLIGPRQSFGNSNGDQTLDGQLDESRIWRNVALTQTQIRDWMCKKITSAHPAYSNLFAYYRLDEGSGTDTYSVGGQAGTLINSPSWVISGASLGDGSAYDYTNATKTASISHAGGENFTVTSTSGAPAGIQVYRIDDQPNTLTGTSGVGPNNKYFGTFQIGGATPQYSAVYNYAGNPYVNSSNEPSLRLFNRADNSVQTWVLLNNIPNQAVKTISVAGQSTEYILGSVGSPLPLTLISFKATKQNSSVLLKWITANEVNFSHFGVERSRKDNNFSSIGQVAANNIASLQNYSLGDKNPLNGTNFYRLKMVDIDGKILYSKVVSVNFNERTAITIYPNPAKDYIKVDGVKEGIEIGIIDASGKMIKRFITNASNRYSISSLIKGLYLVKIQDKENTTVFKLIIE